MYPDIYLVSGELHWIRCSQQIGVELWTEVWGQTSNPDNTITVLSWYTYEWNADAELVNTYYVTSATTAAWSQAIYPQGDKKGL